MRSFLLATAFSIGASAIAAPPDANRGHLRMALVNMKCLLTDTADAEANRRNLSANIDRHRWFATHAAGEGAEFVGFPELSINGYHFSKDTTWLSIDGPEVRSLAAIAVERKIWLSAGIAEQDGAGKRWNTQFVIAPDGKIAGWHHKIWLTAEKGHVEMGDDHNVFPVKDWKMGISTCADGTDYQNLKALAERGARIIYGPHANTTGGTIAGWYNFRAKWGGAWDGAFGPAKTSNDGPPSPAPSGGWIAQLKVFAALHNHAAHYDPAFDPPDAQIASGAWASGAWFIGPDGKTLAQMPASTNRADSKEYLLIYNVPLGDPERK